MFNKKSHTTEDELLELLFEGRNKDYGAYELRKQYKSHLKTAVWIVLLSTVVIWLLADFSGKERMPVFHEYQVNKVELRNYRQPKPPVKTIKDHVPIKRKTQNPPPVATDVYAPPVIRAKPDDIIRFPKISVDSLHDAISVLKEEGAHEQFDIKPKDDTVLHDIKIAVSKRLDASIEDAYTKVQRVPLYVGGKAAWLVYLKSNLKIAVPLQNGAMPGPYLVTIAFLVHPDSTTSDFKIVRDPGYGAGQEALRVVKGSGKWVPGMKGNKIVTFAQLQDVLFEVHE